MHKKSILKDKDFQSALIFIVVSAIFFAFSLAIKDTGEQYFGVSKFIPQTAAGLLMVSSLSLLLSSIKKHKIALEKESVEKITTSELGDKSNEENKEEKDAKKVYFVFGALIIYFLLMEFLGFIIASICFSFIALNVFHKEGKRNHVKYLIVSVVQVAIIYLLFTYAFDILLP